MTPKCGRIDVKYANFSYHTRIGLGKWTHDPTLVMNKHLLVQTDAPRTWVDHCVLKVDPQSSGDLIPDAFLALHLPEMVLECIRLSCLWQSLIL